MAITTLNQVVKGLKNIANAHQQVRSFADVDPVDFATSGTTYYPAVLAVLVNPGEITRNTASFNFELYFMDKTRSGETNITEVQSDMFLIAKDFQAEMRHPDWTWIVDFADKNSMEVFAEKFDDWVAGWKLKVKITLQNPDDTCQIPQGSITRF